MKKINKFFVVLSVCVLIFALFTAEDYATVEELIDEMNSVVEVENVQEQDLQVVDDGERLVASSSEIDLSDQLVVLQSIALAVNNIQASTLFNINSTQVEFFKGILLEDPFADYVITFDGSYDYRLYYGHNLEVGDSCSFARIYRVQTGSGYSFDYVTVTGDTSTVPSSSVYVSTLDESLPVLEEVENAKTQKIIFIGACVALALWVLSKIFFR